ncbi:MAG: hypothetical protein KGQ66_01240 [Acidobacteriota bacterium]|nr:hypothetical protein [Acidobacteriota bacterium]
MSGDPMDLELATTALLADTHDLRNLLKMLARQLSGALGDRVRVEREGGRFRRSEEVRSLKVRIGGDEFAAEVRDAAVETTVGHESGGIRIRTEKVPADAWLARLLAELRKEAESNQAARLAMENLLMGGWQ